MPIAQNFSRIAGREALISSSLAENVLLLSEANIALSNRVEAADAGNSEGLRVVRGGLDMGQPSHADKLFEVLGDELWPVVGDNPSLSVGILFQGRL